VACCLVELVASNRRWGAALSPPEEDAGARRGRRRQHTLVVTVPLIRRVPGAVLLPHGALGHVSLGESGLAAAGGALQVCTPGGGRGHRRGSVSARAQPQQSALSGDGCWRLVIHRCHPSRPLTKDEGGHAVATGGAAFAGTTLRPASALQEVEAGGLRHLGVAIHTVVVVAALTAKRRGGAGLRRLRATHAHQSWPALLALRERAALQHAAADTHASYF
jgi:hypothetical protein